MIFDRESEKNNENFHIMMSRNIYIIYIDGQSQIYIQSQFSSKNVIFFNKFFVIVKPDPVFCLRIG
jgi:hypothetical protein